jgi:hypothetical protein
MMEKKSYRYRCARTGRYVTKEYAEKNPDTTVRITVRNKGKSKNKLAEKPGFDQ